MNWVSYIQGVLHSFSMKHIFYGKMNLRLFYFSGFIAQICWFYKNGGPQVTFAMKERVFM